MMFDNPLQSYKKENIVYVLSPFKSIKITVKHLSTTDFLIVGEKYSKATNIGIVCGV